jgi:Mycothiol maleylpyruvate isomerase N-terminal domain
VTIDRSYVDANRASLDRMRAFVEGASDEDLHTVMPAGWTVGAVLGHLAFWDERVAVILDMLERGVKPSPYDEEAVDWINDTSKRFLLAMEPRALAELSLEIAAATDDRLAGLSDERLVEVTQLWCTQERWRDRTEHLDEIDQALAAAGRGIG